MVNVLVTGPESGRNGHPLILLLSVIWPSLVLSFKHSLKM